MRGDRITPSDSYNFVTMPNGTIRAARAKDHADFSTHIGVSGGDDVLYAGTVQFANRHSSSRGSIRTSSNNSGHYRPPASLSGNAGLPNDLFIPQ